MFNIFHKLRTAIKEWSAVPICEIHNTEKYEWFPNSYSCLTCDQEAALVQAENERKGRIREQVEALKIAFKELGIDLEVIQASKDLAALFRIKDAEKE